MFLTCYHPLQSLFFLTLTFSQLGLVGPQSRWLLRPSAITAEVFQSAADFRQGRRTQAYPAHFQLQMELTISPDSPGSYWWETMFGNTARTVAVPIATNLPLFLDLSGEELKTRYFLGKEEYNFPKN